MPGYTYWKENPWFPTTMPSLQHILNSLTGRRWSRWKIEPTNRMRTILNITFAMSCRWTCRALHRSRWKWYKLTTFWEGSGRKCSAIPISISNSAISWGSGTSTRKSPSSSETYTHNTAWARRAGSRLSSSWYKRRNGWALLRILLRRLLSISINWGSSCGKLMIAYLKMYKWSQTTFTCVLSWGLASRRRPTLTGPAVRWEISITEWSSPSATPKNHRTCIPTSSQCKFGTGTWSDTTTSSVKNASIFTKFTGLSRRQWRDASRSGVRWKSKRKVLPSLTAFGSMCSIIRKRMSLVYRKLREECSFLSNWFPSSRLKSNSRMDTEGQNQMSILLCPTPKEGCSSISSVPCHSSSKSLVIILLFRSKIVCEMVL